MERAAGQPFDSTDFDRGGNARQALLDPADPEGDVFEGIGRPLVA